MKQVDSSKPIIEHMDSTKNVVWEDGLPVKYFTIIAERTYLYNSPSVTDVTRRFILKGDEVKAYYKSGEFTYIKPAEISEGNRDSGWIYLKDVKEAGFAPPKIVHDE